MRLKGVKQHDNEDCGAAVFATVLNYYGDHLSLAKARELVHTSKNGSTINGLVQAFEQLKLEVRALEEEYSGEILDVIEKKEVSLPLIAHIVTKEGLSHFVVIYQKKGEVLSIFNPASGKVKQKYAEFKDVFSGMFIDVALNQDYQPIVLKNNRFQKYWEIIKKVKLKILGTILVSFIISGISICGSLLYQKVIDGFILRRGTTFPDHSNFLLAAINTIITNFNYLFLAVFLLYLFQALLALIRSQFIANLSVQSGRQLFIDLFTKLMHLPVDFFSNREMGDFLSRFQIVSEFQARLADVIITIFLEIFMAVAGGIVLFKISAPLFGITCLLVVSYLMVTLIFINPLKKINSELIDANSASLTVYNATIKGIEEIKMTNSSDNFINLFTEKISNLLNIGKKAIIFQSIQSILVFLLESAGVIFILWQGSRLVINQRLTLGSLIAFETLIAFFMTPLKNIIQKQKEIQDLFVMADKLDDIFEVESESTVVKNELPVTAPPKIQLEQVDFSYGAGKLILENLNYQFEAGTHYGLVGRSGTGKTSLLKMIASLAKPESGQISYCGVNIADDLLNYRSLVSYLPNNPILFSGTIRENLIMGQDHVSESQILNVVHGVGLDQMVQDLPAGIETKVTENAQNFSSGQRQRIGIARALISLPQVLILDEALSNLDHPSQKQIIAFIKDLLKDRILIMTAHDPEWNQFADILLEIKNHRLINIQNQKII